MFTHAGKAWSQQAELAAADAAATDAFGSSVAVSGSYAMAGAPGLFNNHANPTEAYVFANV